MCPRRWIAARVRRGYSWLAWGATQFALRKCRRSTCACRDPQDDSPRSGARRDRSPATSMAPRSLARRRPRGRARSQRRRERRCSSSTADSSAISGAPGERPLDLPSPTTSATSRSATVPCAGVCVAGGRARRATHRSWGASTAKILRSHRRPAPRRGRVFAEQQRLVWARGATRRI
jgi:hypothetical protein